MTPKDIQTALNMLRKRIGGDAYVSVDITYGNEPPISGCIYPRGITKSNRIGIKADDWPEAITKLNEAWNESRERLQDDLIKRMALAIIRLTEECGECTDQMLRADFGHGDVTAYLERAVEMADKMAANGPFSVRRISASNVA